MKPMRRAPFVLAALAAVCLGGAQTRAHNYDLLSVRWSVRLNPDDSSLSGDVTNTLRPEKGAKTIRFDFGSLEVDSVEVNEKPATAKRVTGGLEVPLTDPVDGASDVAIRIRYHGKPGAGAYFIPAKRAYPATTPVVYTQGEMEDNRYWLPTYDYPDDKALSEGTIDVPEGWFALSNGALIDQKTEVGRTVYHWKMDKPHATYLISFTAGAYEKGHGEWDGIPIDYYVPKGLADQGEAAFGMTPDIVRFYSTITGFRYPYAKYSQSAVPDYMFGGMENITATTQTITALHPKSIEPLELSWELVAHELAHQWFGDTVSTNGWADAWINEGWATFMPPFYAREKFGQEEFDIERYGIFQGGLAAHQARPDRPVVYAGYHDALDMFDGFIYPGGASRMFMLMRMVGEDRFWKATTAYLEQRKYTAFDTQAFFDTYSKNLGMDLKPFMKQWFFTNGAPNLTVSLDGKDLVVAQTSPLFTLDLPVWVLNNGDWKKFSLHLEKESARLPLGDLAGKPVLIDPECWTMASITNKVPLTVEQLTTLFLTAPNGGEQERMMDSMMDSLNPEQWLSLAVKVKSKRILGDLIGHLDDGSQGYLIGLTRDPDVRIVDAAAVKLGFLPSTPASIGRLQEMVTDHSNDLLRQHVFRSLMHLTKSNDMAEEAWKTEGGGDGYRIMAIDFWRESKPDVARDRCLEVLKGGFPEPTRVHAIDTLGELKDKKGSREVYKALTYVLAENSFGARNTAIGALGAYGDPAAIPLLQPLTKAELVFFRHSAQAAIVKLKH